MFINLGKTICVTEWKEWLWTEKKTGYRKSYDKDWMAGGLQQSWIQIEFKGEGCYIER